MHPAEEFEVFRDLVVERGWSHEAVATRFGVTIRRVEQRLKLAPLSPVILEAWKDGALVQAQVEAFALSDDHERQRHYCEESSDWALKPETICKAMSDQALQVGRDRLATFVGREAYEAAGGIVTTDLFADAVYLSDTTLVRSLAETRLRSIADRIVGDEGWAFVVRPILHEAGPERRLTHRQGEGAGRGHQPVQRAPVRSVRAKSSPT